MKIIAYDNFKPGITLDDLKPYLRDEVSNVWRLWKAGVARENYARADVGGVVIVFECADVDEAKRYIEDFPLTKAGLIEWQYIALGAALPLESLFDPTVDVGEPFDRTMRDRISSPPGEPDHEACKRSVRPRRAGRSVRPQVHRPPHI